LSQEKNVEIVREALSAMADADLDELLRLFHPEIEYLPLTHAQVEGRGYRGHAGVRQYYAEARELWHEMHPVADSFSTNGADVVVVGSCKFRGRGSEINTKTPMAWVFTVRDGKIVRYRGFPTSAAARAAAGLAE
jgi:ketosteroid isomerase-like protein